MVERYQAATRILQRPGADALLMVRRATLTISAAPSGTPDGATLTIEGDPVVIGSGVDCDLTLADAAVSAQHLRVSPTREGFLAEDLGSTNGSFVDGYRVQAIYLPARAELRLGDSVLAFSVLDEEIELTLSRRTRFGELLGHSDAMRRIFSILERIADTPSTVLLEGESGTGKELAARALHEASARRGEPFVVIDCGALPESLIESELFGHAKGAFTGATTAKAGLFEQAEGGTLFLDELGELPLDLQPKLLRVLESRTVRRIGEASSRAIDVRLVAATNRNLAHEVKAGRFREDLFFRLSVIRLRLPPLRERAEEIPRLVAHFLERLGADPTRAIPDAMLALLCSHCWPGNVRELRNVVERLALLPGMAPDFYFGGLAAGDGDEGRDASATASATTALELPLDESFHEGKRLWSERFEREYLHAKLEACEGNISELARQAGLSRQTCYRLLKRYLLEPNGS